MLNRFTLRTRALITLGLTTLLIAVAVLVRAAKEKPVQAQMPASQSADTPSGEAPPSSELPVAPRPGTVVSKDPHLRVS